MREIRFRAWKDGRMLAWKELATVPMAAFGEMYMTNPPRAVALFMQFTGLKDKNGVEIYEGDIVKYSFLGDLRHGGTGAIEFHNSCFHVDRFFLWDYAEGSKDWQIEVIGNIHQNRELLNQ